VGSQSLVGGAFGRVGERWAGWRLKKNWKKLCSIDVHTALSQARTAVICLPNNPSDLAAARAFIGDIAEWWPQPTIITLADPGSFPPDYDMDDPPIARFESPTNAWRLPHKHAARFVRKIAPDVFVDLNRTYRLSTAYLAVQSAAYLRVGFRGASHDFFNLAYGVTSQEKSATQIYKDLVDTLQAHFV